MPVERGAGVRWVQLHPSFGSDFPPPFFFLLCFLFVCACVLVMEVGDVQRYPYPVSGKLTHIFLDGKRSVGVPPPPPPPPHQLFQDLRDFRGWRRADKKLLRTDLVQNPHPPFQKASYGPGHGALFDSLIFQITFSSN